MLEMNMNRKLLAVVAVAVTSIFASPYGAQAQVYLLSVHYAASSASVARCDRDFRSELFQ